MYKVNGTKGKGIACWVLCFLIVLMAVSSMALCVSAVEVEMESAVSAVSESVGDTPVKVTADVGVQVIVSADVGVQEVERGSIGESAVSAEREETESNSGADNKVQEVERESIGESAVSAESEETESNSGADAEDVLFWFGMFLLIMFVLVGLGLAVSLP